MASILIRVSLLFLLGVLFLGLGACHSNIIRAVGPFVSKDAVFHFKCSEKLVALTIDDGPDQSTTQPIIETLESHGASATFFIIGERTNPELLKLIVDSGNELGNHGYTEEPLTRFNHSEILDSINKTDLLIDPHHDVKWFRPGKGRYNDDVLKIIKDKGYVLVLADVYPYDHIITSTNFHSWYINHSIKPGSIIVLHDYERRGERTKETLDKILPKLKQKGYAVVSLGELYTSGKCAD